jgi:hypothetical protein
MQRTIPGMKSNSVVTVGSLLLVAAASASAQEKPVPPPAPPPPAAPPAVPPSAGLVNDWLRRQASLWQRWDFGGQFRARYEFKENFAVPGTTGAADFRRTTPVDENSYLLLRTRLHVGYTPTDWFSAFAEGQNSSTTGDERDPNPESNGPVDLRQGYVVVGNTKQGMAPNPVGGPLSAKVGRQELIYGDERLIGASDWNNIGRVFDAAKGRYQNEQLWVDAFVGRVIIPDDNNFDMPNDYDWFSGAYASTRTYVPGQETQVYFLARNVSDQSSDPLNPALPAILRGASPRDIYTVGARVKSLPGARGPWDYDAELAGQWGDYAFSAAGPRLEHHAFAAHAAGGHTWGKTWGAPRLGLEYNYASGDDNPNDNEHGTFENLFPTNHKFYGYMDFFSWQNIHDVRMSGSIKPHRQVQVSLDYHAFWLADTHDFFYQVNGSPRTTGGYGINPSAGNFVGQELDLVATYSPKNFASLQAGYGHFFVGEYVRDSLQAVGGASDANWVYVQAVFNF